MHDVSVRNATAADVDDLLELWSRAGENASRPDDRPDLVHALIEHDAEAVLLAELDGYVVATIIGGWDGWRANLYRLAVDPACRGQGLGRRMVELAEERLRRLGAERVCAMVLDDNEEGRGLWRACGYAPQDDWSRWVKQAR